MQRPRPSAKAYKTKPANTACYCKCYGVDEAGGAADVGGNSVADAAQAQSVLDELADDPLGGLHLLLMPVPVSRAPARTTRSALLASRASTAGRVGAAPTASGKTSKHKLTRLLPPARHRGHDMRQRTHERTGRHLALGACAARHCFTWRLSRSVAFYLHSSMLSHYVFPSHVLRRVACPCAAAGHFSEFGIAYAASPQTPLPCSQSCCMSMYSSEPFQ